MVLVTEGRQPRVSGTRHGENSRVGDGLGRTVRPAGVARLSRELVVSALWPGSRWTTLSGADFPVGGKKGEEGGRGPGQHRQAAGAVTPLGAARPLLTGKEIVRILRKTRARAGCCGRRIGVTSWPLESGSSSRSCGIRGQEAFWGLSELGLLGPLRVSRRELIVHLCSLRTLLVFHWSVPGGNVLEPPASLSHAETPRGRTENRRTTSSLKPGLCLRTRRVQSVTCQL